MRLFIGIPLAPAVAEQLAALRARLERPDDGLRWSSPESWHITLQFLGATTETQYLCVVHHLHNVSAAAVPIYLDDLGFFDRAGVFFVGVRITPNLASLQQLVITATSQCGYEAEERPYHPHITLARKKGRSDGLRQLKPRIGASPSFPACTAREFLLYQSFPGPTGSRYDIRARFPLGAT